MPYKDIQHIVRIIVLLAGAAAVAFFVRSLFIPPTFGEFGTYRGASVREIMDQPVKYQGVENCRSCHEKEWGEWHDAKHKSVACESCHGPGLEHSNPDVEPPPKILGSKELMAKSHDLCLSCHSRSPGRRPSFPQVDVVNHIHQFDITRTDAGHERPIATGNSTASTQEPGPEDTPLPEEYSCNFCHGEDGTLSGSENTKHLVITAGHLAGDVHWRSGIRCHDCHGGNPDLEGYVDHRDDPGFRAVTSPEKMTEFCGHCHFDAEQIRRYAPERDVDEFVEYLSTRHGRRLQEKKNGDSKVITCVTCHGRHGIRAIADQGLPVNCVPCHKGHTPARW